MGRETEEVPVSTPLLEISGVTKRFGNVAAVDSVSLSIDQGEVVGLIGPNGSGKTTLIHCITGALVPEEGQIRFNGEDITGAAPFRVARKGIARSFQNLEDFPTLSVLDHLMLATQHGKPVLGRRTPDEGAHQLLSELALSHMAERPAGELSYGQRKLLGIAMARIREPELMIMDEPTAGVNPVLAQSIVAELRRLATSGQTIILVEHDIPLVISLVSRLIVMSSGAIIADGHPDEVRSDPDVREAYFGR